MSSSNTSRLYATTLGYYSHTEGARYISPIVTGAKFPDLVELHESQHAHLALGNASDGLGRLFAGVIEWGAGELHEDHQTSIRNMFAVIHEHTIYVHELIATWVSFALFALRRPDDLGQARNQLPRFYEQVLRDGEAAFGSIGDPRVEVTDGLLAMTCAIAAMNVRYPVDVVRFDRLGECAELVRKNSPNARFRMILGRVRPRWKNDRIFTRSGIFAGFSAQEDPSDLQLAVIDRIRDEFPNLQLLTFKERETLFQSWSSELKADARKHGYSFLEYAEVERLTEDTPEGRFGARITLPGLRPEQPLDLSLVSMHYAAGALQDLKQATQVCAREQRWLFAHVFFLASPVMKTEVVCFASQRSKGSNLVPFVARCAFAELVEVLTELPRGAVILKIDERCGRWAAAKLGATGQPVFVLLHDTRPKTVIATIREGAAGQKIIVSKLPMLGDEYSALLAVFEQERICLMAPITRLGMVLVEDKLAGIKNVFCPTQAECVRYLPARLEIIAELAYTCFAA